MKAGTSLPSVFLSIEKSCSLVLSAEEEQLTDAVADSKRGNSSQQEI